MQNVRDAVVILPPASTKSKTRLRKSDEYLIITESHMNKLKCQHIYGLYYIVENAPVSTADIVALEIVSRRQTFNLIRALEKVDKIERIGHGKYIAL